MATNGQQHPLESAHSELTLTLRRLRKARGMSQRALAKPLLLSSHSTVADYESGRRIPPADTLRRYERFFGTRPGELTRLRELALAELADSDEQARRHPPDARQRPGADAGNSIPRQLPAGPANFVGRDDALAWLGRHLVPSSAPWVLAVSGMGGVGKTALAVHFAHQVAARFPDGQLYANLRGFDPSGQPADTGAVVRSFLDVLGVPPARIPADLDAQAGLYRSLLAGKRMLVIADNARDAGQVRPLLPGAPGCLVLVTSRMQLTGLLATDGADLTDLDVLTSAEAADLLAARLGPGRVTAEPEAVAEIISWCGRLPLALAIMAARAAVRPEFSLRAITSNFGSASGRLNAFSGGDDPVADVRAVFSWSYHALSPAAARLFRLLGLHPGPDISAPAAASLAGLPAPEVLPSLAELADAHLIDEHLPGRYAPHDLLRAYAAELARAQEPDGEQRAAVHRMLDHYLHTACTAATELVSPSPVTGVVTSPPPQAGTAPEQLDGYQAAWAWFEAEYPVLLAAIQQAAATGWNVHAWQLPWRLKDYLDRRGLWHDMAATQYTALNAARSLPDQQGQACAHTGIGRANGWLSRYDDANSHLRQALDMFSKLGDRQGQAGAHMHLHWTAGRQGRPADGLHHARQAAALFRADGDLHGQAYALNGAGEFHAQLGDNHRAIACCQEAITLFQSLGDRTGEAATLDTLGQAHQNLGQYEQAAASYQHALSLLRETGEEYLQTIVLGNLGDAYRSARNLDAARDTWQRALNILDRLDHPDAAHTRAKLVALEATMGADHPA